MKTIHEELSEALNNIAKNYGVVINTLTINWIETSAMEGESYMVHKIETEAKIIRVIK